MKDTVGYLWPSIWRLQYDKKNGLMSVCEISNLSTVVFISL